SDWINHRRGHSSQRVGRGERHAIYRDNWRGCGQWRARERRNRLYWRKSMKNSQKPVASSETTELEKLAEGSIEPNSTAGYRGLLPQPQLTHTTAKRLHTADGKPIPGGKTGAA